MAKAPSNSFRINRDIPHIYVNCKFTDLKTTPQSLRDSSPFRVADPNLKAVPKREGGKPQV